jgi:iron(III) transport system ATP-binding protein
VTGFDVVGVHKAFRGQRVLRGVDLTIESGTLTAILGASGSGKTTLLRILAGFERADRGTVTMGGRVVDDGRHHLAPERRRVGYVPQEGALFPHLTVAANVGFGLDRDARRAGRVTEVLDLVDLGHLASRYPHQLSGGQQQRVALARALAIKPSIVLLDEPFSSLDAALRASVRTDVARVLHTAGATALLVTHDQDEALSMADRVAVLRDGVIAQIGTPQQLYERPADLDLAGFLGEANVMRGIASGGTVTIELGTVQLSPDSPAAQRNGAGRADVLVAVRPEQITVRPVGNDATSAAAGVRGHVQDLHYFGHDAIMAVRPADGGPLIRVRVAGGEHLHVGEAVSMIARGPVPGWPAVESEAASDIEAGERPGVDVRR